MDTLETLIDTRIQQVLRQEVWGTSATVDTYDPATHRAKVTLQPSGEGTGYLPVLTPHTGLADTVQPGTPCYVHCERNVPVAVSGLHFNDNTPVPTAALSLGNDVHIAGNLTLYGGSLTCGAVAELPTASADLRGQLLYLAPAVDGQSGTADAVYACLMSATGTYSWVKLAGG